MPNKKSEFSEFEGIISQDLLDPEDETKTSDPEGQIPDDGLMEHIRLLRPDQGHVFSSAVPTTSPPVSGADDEYGKMSSFQPPSPSVSSATPPVSTPAAQTPHRKKPSARSKAFSRARSSVATNRALGKAPPPISNSTASAVPTTSPPVSAGKGEIEDGKMSGFQPPSPSMSSATPPPVSTRRKKPSAWNKALPRVSPNSNSTASDVASRPRPVVSGREAENDRRKRQVLDRKTGVVQPTTTVSRSHPVPDIAKRALEPDIAKRALEWAQNGYKKVAPVDSYGQPTWEDLTMPSESTIRSSTLFSNMGRHHFIWLCIFLANVNKSMDLGMELLLVDNNTMIESKWLNVSLTDLLLIANNNTYTGIDVSKIRILLSPARFLHYENRRNNLLQKVSNFFSIEGTITNVSDQTLYLDIIPLANTYPWKGIETGLLVAPDLICDNMSRDVLREIMIQIAKYGQWGLVFPIYTMSGLTMLDVPIRFMYHDCFDGNMYMGMHFQSLTVRLAFDDIGNLPEVLAPLLDLAGVYITSYEHHADNMVDILISTQAPASASSPVPRPSLPGFGGSVMPPTPLGARPPLPDFSSPVELPHRPPLPAEFLGPAPLPIAAPEEEEDNESWTPIASRSAHQFRDEL